MKRVKHFLWLFLSVLTLGCSNETVKKPFYEHSTSIDRIELANQGRSILIVADHHLSVGILENDGINNLTSINFPAFDIKTYKNSFFAISPDGLVVEYVFDKNGTPIKKWQVQTKSKTAELCVVGENLIALSPYESCSISLVHGVRKPKKLPPCEFGTALSNEIVNVQSDKVMDVLKIHDGNVISSRTLNSAISAIVATPKSVIWVATEDGHLVTFDRTLTKKQVILKLNGSHYVRSLRYVRNGDMVIFGTNRGAVGFVNPNSHKVYMKEITTSSVSDCTANKTYLFGATLEGSVLRIAPNK